MSRALYKRLLILSVVTLALLALDTSSANAQYYGWWSRGPLRRTVAFVFSPWVRTWRAYYGYGYGYGYGGYGGGYSCSPCCGDWHVVCNSPSTAPTPSAPPAPKDDTASLILSVPEGAQVLVNGKETTSTGKTRTYFSGGLLDGRQYKYAIRVLRGEGDEATEQTKTVYLTGGTRSRLAFDDLDVTSPVVPVSLATPAGVETTLRLHVPADAKVTLGGNPTAIRGALRTYRTTNLPAGETWQDYRIEALVERDGRRLVAEKTIILSGGETRDVYLDLQAEQ
jgi:uncharacterized protein (TIGR03000 family)